MVNFLNGRAFKVTNSKSLPQECWNNMGETGIWIFIVNVDPSLRKIGNFGIQKIR